MVILKNKSELCESNVRIRIIKSLQIKFEIVIFKIIENRISKDICELKY